MRIDRGDLVILRSSAISILKGEGHQLEGYVAEVVDLVQGAEGIDAVLRFNELKTLITDIPIEMLQPVGIC